MAAEGGSSASGAPFPEQDTGGSGWRPAYRLPHVARLGPVRVPLPALANRPRVRRLVEAIDDRLPHGHRTVPYCGYDVVYSRGNSLVERIRQQGTYEPGIVASIREAVAASPSRTLLDVGANIGLISLAVLAAIPESCVFAFEPGPHQQALLAETIRRNGLEGRLELSDAALSDASGTASFAVHSTKHAAGDGFLDTHRSGPARTVRVRTETVDDWWERKGRPPVGVVKLDTEGSELLILRGAAAFLDACRPTLFLEIHETNLEPYPYDAADVRAQLEGWRYVLEAVGPAEYVARPA
jgi:FkbM family methyltransferase